MRKCPHCRSRRIRRRYRQHRRYNWRCRRCNRVFARPNRNVWLWIGAAAVIVMIAAYVLTQDIISIPSTPARLDEPTDRVVKVVTYTATPETAVTQTPVQSAAQVDTPTAIPTHTRRPTSTSRPTRTPRPTYTPRPTTTTPPTPTQIPGRSDLYKPIYPPNHMAAVAWAWNSGYSGFQSIDFDFTIHNDIDADDLLPHFGLYLMLDSSYISGTLYYFGLQTDVQGLNNRGKGKGLIFSRWDTRDLANVRVADGGWSTSSGGEGDFVGVRKPYRWGAGEYGLRIAADGEDDEGRWFGLWITDRATGETTWCGSLRFPYRNGKALLDNIHRSVDEIYGDPVGIKPIDIPEWHIIMQRPVADGRSQPTEAHISYTNWDGVSAGAPNSDITYDTSSGAMHIRVGDTTQRTTAEGWIDLDVK